MSGMPGFDPATAFTYASVIEAVYRAFSARVLDPSVSSIVMPSGWYVSNELTAVDRIGRTSEPEFYGVVARSSTEAHTIVAIRGTDTMLEWLVDAECAPRRFPGAADAGLVEDGFCGVYSSLRCSVTGADVPTLLRQSSPDTSVTIAGHSLGAAAATLLAAEVGVSGITRELTLYTFASPRVGDATFSSFAAAHVPTHFRVVNEPDIVPRMPPFYTHTGTEVLLDSRAHREVAHSIGCYHTLTTYLWLLNQESSFGLGACHRPGAPAATP